MPETVNLLMETVKAIRKLNKKPEHIAWVGSIDGKYAVSWSEFELIAAGTWYDSGHSRGNADVAEDLVIVFVATGPHTASWMEFEPGQRGPVWKSYKEPHKAPDARKFSKVAGFDAFTRGGG